MDYPGLLTYLGSVKRFSLGKNNAMVIPQTDRNRNREGEENEDEIITNTKSDDEQ